MTDHTCPSANPACYRCDLGMDESEGHAADMRQEAALIAEAIAALDHPRYVWVCQMLRDEIKDRNDSADYIDRQVADYRARQQKAREVVVSDSAAVAKVHVRLPRLVGGRERIDQLIDAVGPFADLTFVVEARELRSGGPSAADQIVARTLVDGAAKSVEVLGVDDRLAEYLAQAADRRGVRDRLHLGGVA